MTTETLKQFIENKENMPVVVEIKYCGHTCETIPAQLQLQDATNKYGRKIQKLVIKCENLCIKQ